MYLLDTITINRNMVDIDHYEQYKKYKEDLLSISEEHKVSPFKLYQFGGFLERYLVDIDYPESLVPLVRLVNGFTMSTDFNNIKTMLLPAPEEVEHFINKINIEYDELKEWGML